MKKFIFSTMTVCFLSITGPGIVQAAPSNHPTVVMTDIKDESPEVQAMVKRIEEIKAMDFKSMSREQKKAVKQELREMKKNKTISGIYLSTGAIIIILLILLLVL